MKKDFLKNIPRMTADMVAKPIQQVYEEINTECNNFLKTQKGLQYLLMKYPNLSMEQAVREHYAHVWICENYDGTEF